MLKDEIRTGNFITILYTFMSALWTLLAISKGVWIDAGIGTCMTVFGLAELADGYGCSTWNCRSYCEIFCSLNNRFLSFKMFYGWRGYL